MSTHDERTEDDVEIEMCLLASEVFTSRLNFHSSFIGVQIFLLLSKPLKDACRAYREVWLRSNSMLNNVSII